MIDKSEITPKRCRPSDFVRMASIVLGDAEYYEDELIEIRNEPRSDDKMFEITRKPISQNGTPYTELLVDNPVTMRYKGSIIRHHGEHIYLTAHLEKLVEAKGECQYLTDRTDNTKGDDDE